MPSSILVCENSAIFRSLSLNSPVMRMTGNPSDPSRPDRIEVVVFVRQRRLLDVQVFERSAFSLMNAFHCRAPSRRQTERVHACRADRPAIGHGPEVGAPGEVRPE